MLTKKEFCKYIDKLKTAWDTDLKVSELAREARTDFLGSDMCYLGTEYCELLSKAMSSDSEDIEFFCFVSNFGRDWESGMVTDENGNDIDLSTAEKLYDFLVSEAGKGSG